MAFQPAKSRRASVPWMYCDFERAVVTAASSKSRDAHGAIAATEG